MSYFSVISSLRITDTQLDSTSVTSASENWVSFVFSRSLYSHDGNGGASQALQKPFIVSHCEILVAEMK